MIFNYEPKELFYRLNLLHNLRAYDIDIFD